MDYLYLRRLSGGMGLSDFRADTGSGAETEIRGSALNVSVWIAYTEGL